jgi:ADP-ribose pyrophosphatase YjhB (NUDIX family)
VAKFCSGCGCKLGNLDDTGASQVAQCSHCGTFLLQGPSVIVSVFAYQGDRLLMMRRAHPPGAGEWSIPSGFLEPNETLEEAAARETLEETGVRIPIEDLHPYSIVSFVTLNQVQIGFRAELTGAIRPACGPESLDVGMRTQMQVSRSKLAFENSIGDYTRRFFAYRQANKFPIASIQIVRGEPSRINIRSYPLLAMLPDVANLEAPARVSNPFPT